MRALMTVEFFRENIGLCKPCITQAPSRYAIGHKQGINASYTSKLAAGEKHTSTISTFVDQTRIQLTRQRKKKPDFNSSFRVYKIIGFLPVQHKHGLEVEITCFSEFELKTMNWHIFPKIFSQIKDSQCLNVSVGISLELDDFN